MINLLSFFTLQLPGDPDAVLSPSGPHAACAEARHCRYLFCRAAVSGFVIELKPIYLI
jgi:hypothetical protein